MSDTGDILRTAKALISDPVDWNQDGDYVRMDNEHCMCAFGAIQRAEEDCDTTYYVGIFEKGSASDAIKKAAKSFTTDNVVVYNDDFTTSHADIMKLFDRAAEIADAV